MQKRQEKNRISTEVIDSILRSLGEGSTRTKIMYSAYLSFSQVNTYLSLLIEKDLILYEPETRLYKVTRRGMLFVESLEEVRITLGETEKGPLEYPSLEETRSVLITPLIS
jgi:predicted transcriptional regulator